MYLSNYQCLFFGIRQNAYAFRYNSRENYNITCLCIFLIQSPATSRQQDYKFMQKSIRKQNQHISLLNG
jgi:hypothetical protein